MRKQHILAAVATVLAFATSSSFAADTGLYAAATVGAAYSDFTSQDNATNTVGGLTLGYRVNKLFGAEATVSNHGSVSLAGGKAKEVSGTFSGLVHGQLSPKADGYLKAGVAYTQLAGSVEAHKWTQVVGAGIDFSVAPKVAVRLGVDAIRHFGGTDGGQVAGTVGLTYKF